MVKLYSQIITIIMVFTCIITTFSFHPSRATMVHNVLRLEAKPNGVENTTEKILKLWKTACETYRPMTIELIEGHFKLQPLTFEGSNCVSNYITLNITGSLITPQDDHILGKSENWLTFKGVSGVSIVGGNLDANGSSFWNCKTSKGNYCSKNEGATSSRFVNSNNIRIIGLTSSNSQKFHIGINGCQNVHIENVHIIAPASSPNTDGIHLESSTNTTIINSTMQTGDDCISIGPNVRNIHIEGISCGPGHGISIGSLGKKENEEVENVTIKSVKINNTDNGLGIKSWAKPNNGFVKGVLYQNVTLQNVTNPIIVDQHYCPHNICPHQESGIIISNVTYSGIHGTSPTKDAIKFDCSALKPCSAIKLEDINITYLDEIETENENENAQSICDNVEGEVLGVMQPNTCF